MKKKTHLDVHELALFLNCKMWDERIGLWFELTPEMLASARIKHCKPMLRPISSVSNQEKEFYKLSQYTGSNAEKWAKATQTMLLDRIDVFGWIEQGLAVDISKYKTT